MMIATDNTDFHGCYEISPIVYNPCVSVLSVAKKGHSL